MSILIPTEKNIKTYAVENYTNKRCLSSEEFWEDFNKIKYIKRLLGRYIKDGDLKERLILNHLIGFYNVFNMQAATRMLFLRCEEDTWPALKTFLVYLHYLPENWWVQVPLDKHIVKILREN